MGCGVIFRSKKIPRMGGQWSHRRWAKSLRCPKSAGFIIDTSEESPELQGARGFDCIEQYYLRETPLQEG
jgi:hypothetical protein